MKEGCQFHHIKLIMIKMKKRLFILSLFAILIVLVPFNGKAQSGTIKIFSEVKGIIVYVDEVLKGTDRVTIDSITSGSHYLKVTKDNVIIYGDLINVNTNSITTILIKDTKEVEQKILASKYKEQERYKSEKLDVMTSIKYITETTGKTDSKEKTYSYFPGYYSGTGTSESKSTSVTSEVTDWFIIQGQTKISQYDFAKLTKNVEATNTYEKQLKDIENRNHKKARRSRITMIVLGVGIGTLGTIAAVSTSNASGDVARIIATSAAIVGIAGGGALLIGGLVTPTSKYNVYGGNEIYGENLFSHDEAIKQAKQYNQNLKKELGLPENYEPNL